jgi:outer membrane protein assembly factor BamB
MPSPRRLLLALVPLALLPSAGLLAEDWPTYAHDNARSDTTAEQVTLPLDPQWVYTARAAVIPAWPDPQNVAVEGQLEEPRVRFDDAYHVAVAGGAVYFGTSCDNKVYCVDAATGRERWSFFTEGAIRLTPAVQDGRVFVASDDGLIYCLNAADGKLIWAFAAAPTRARVLARNKMTSLHPPRTGVLVDGDAVYCSAGVFPAERVYLYAVRAADGSLIWKNDTISDGSAGQMGFSPQGYLLASGTTLFVPSGRSIPAAFDKATGKFLYQRSYSRFSPTGALGGTYALLVGERLYSGAAAVAEYEQKTGNLGFAIYQGKRLIVTPNVSYMLDATGLSAINRKTFPELSKKLRDLQGRRTSLTTAKPADLQEQLKTVDAEIKATTDAIAGCNEWKTPEPDLESMILAGDTLLAGGKEKVLAANAKTGEIIWRAPVKGSARGLAVSDGRLFVSTDAGTIHCFAPGQPGPAPAPPAAQGYPGDDMAPVYEAAAKSIIAGSGVSKGFCLVLGCGTGRLALALARNSDLMIYGIEPEPAKVAATRKALDAEGVYGTRVCVDEGNLSDLPYADYCANLIVSEEALVSGRLPGSAKEVFRVLKPIGGTVYVGQPGNATGHVRALDRAELESWLKAIDGKSAEVATEGGLWGKVVRGPIPGAGSWTHQYGDTGNTVSSTDTAVKAPLGVLWYGEPGAEDAVNRHVGTAAPLSIDGRVYFQGVKEVFCFDAYNGYQYWRRVIPGAARVGMVRECSNLACNERGLFLSTGKECLWLDAQTGETITTFPVPASADGTPRTWAYVAVVGDTLYGSTSAKSQESDSVFAYDTASGNLKWRYDGKAIRDNTISISDGHMFFADNAATSEERQTALKAKVDELVERKKITPAEAEQELKSADVRVAVALDADTGGILWQRPLDLTDCGAGVLCAMATRGTLVFCGAHSDGHFWPQFLGGEYAARRISALDAETGTPLWSKAIGYRIRPLIVGDTIYAEPWAFDLRTGEQKMRTHPVTGRQSIFQFERPGHHCGNITGCPNLLAFRSGCTAYYDLIGDYGVNHFAGQRPGCWVNLIPCNGLLVEPEASSGCVCAFSIHCTVVLKPRTENKAWGIFGSPGDVLPVRHMAVNVGAPGDRRGADGELWLSYPRPGGRLRLDFTMGVANLPGGGFFSEAPEDVPIEGSDDPWLFASGSRGVTQCRLPLVREDDGAAVYKVRLGFADTENSKPGERVFDIRLQGKVVATDFDVIKAAGGPSRAVFEEFPEVEVQKDLLIEFVPKGQDLPQTPLLNTIQVDRTRVLNAGLSAPSFLVSDLDTEQSASVKVTNSRDEPFEGTLKLTAPVGFTVTPAESAIKIGVDESVAIPAKLAVAQKGDPSETKLDVKLLRPDGTVEAERSGPIKYLGPRGRVVLTPVEDAYVNAGAPAQNFGLVASLLVDGGNQTMGDESYNIGYLKFLVDIPGRSVSVRLRMHTTATAASESGDSGAIHVAEGAWDEPKVTYDTRLQPGIEVGKMGKVGNDVWEERDLNLQLEGKRELTLLIVPTSTDGASYHSREGRYPPELVIEYEPK